MRCGARCFSATVVAMCASFPLSILPYFSSSEWKLSPAPVMLVGALAPALMSSVANLDLTTRARGVTGASVVAVATSNTDMLFEYAVRVLALNPRSPHREIFFSTALLRTQYAQWRASVARARQQTAPEEPRVFDFDCGKNEQVATTRRGITQ